jgi:DcmR-like sensory protein
MFRHSPLFQFKHGDHTCVFYRSEEALFELLTPYIAEGILKGERCFCAQKPEFIKRLIYDLRFLGIDTDREIARGALELHTEDETYFTNNRFEPEAMMEMLTRSIREAQEKGFAGLRTAGEMSWAARGRDECDQVIGYEKMVEECFPGKAVIGLCQYAMNEFTPDVLNVVMENHRLHVADRAADSFHSSLSVRYGGCSAEVVVDKLMLDPRHYYVVQQQRSREILGWGVAPTFESAIAKAEQLAREPAGATPQTAMA